MNSKIKDYRVVYILGSGHSGSTILDIILGINSGFISLGEMNNYDQVVRGNKVCTCGKSILDCSFWKSVHLDYAKKRISAHPFSDIRAQSKKGWKRLFHLTCALLLVKFPFRFPKSLILFLFPTVKKEATNSICLFDSIAKVRKNNNYLVDSSKSPLRMILLYFLLGSRMKTIFLTRDGRAVCASTTKRQNSPVLSMKEKVRKWLKANKYSISALRYINTEDYIHITYEQLCRDSQSVLRKISTFLDASVQINFDSKVDELHTFAGNPSRFQKSFELKEDVKWRSRLDHNDLKVFEKVAGKLNRELLSEYYQD